MKRLHFDCSIHAPAQKVWRILWSAETYPEWTSVFAPGSRAESDWKKGSRVLFVDADNNGLISRVADVRENEYMSFEHLGEIIKGVENTTSDSVKQWSGAKENYILTEKNGVTNFRVELDTTEDHEEYFAKQWPLAMDKLRSLAEK